MSRRGEWSKARDKMVSHLSKKKSVEERETVPEICCGKCKNFSERAQHSDGSGFCGVLKEGSDFNVNPPVYLLEGKVASMVVFNMESSKCKYFDQMELIDTDTTECADPAYQRAARQMDKR